MTEKRESKKIEIISLSEFHYVFELNIPFLIIDNRIKYVKIRELIKNISRTEFAHLSNVYN